MTEKEIAYLISTATEEERKIMFNALVANGDFRELYRKQMILETDKGSLADNCRLALDRFFMAFKPSKEKIITSHDLLIAFAPLIAKGVSITYADTEWRIFDLETIKEIKKYSWWKEGVGGLEYELNEADCDDFAEFSKAMFSMFWRTNSMGRCTGYITYNGETTAHAFDIILALDNNEVKPYLFDTQFDIDPVLLTDKIGTVNKTSWNIINIRI